MQTALTASPVVAAARPTGRRAAVVTRAAAEEPTSRRAALAGLASSTAAALALAVGAAPPALAAYGEAARVFGSAPTNATGFTRYEGEGFSFDVPAKYNPSKERPPTAPGFAFLVNFQDNGDLTNSLAVYSAPAGGKSTVSAYGTPEAVLAELGWLFGDSTAYTGETRSEGGFGANKIAAASLLRVEPKTVEGKEYYTYEVLTRTADGDEGGRHHLISACVGSSGTLFVQHSITGDKRFFKGASRGVEGALNTFRVA